MPSSRSSAVITVSSSISSFSVPSKTISLTFTSSFKISSKSARFSKFRPFFSLSAASGCLTFMPASALLASARLAIRLISFIAPKSFASIIFVSASGQSSK